MTLRGNCIYWQKKPTPNGLQTNNKKWQGIQAPSIQLLLMKEQPDTLDGALMLARRQLSVEVAQKNLSSTKNSHHLVPIMDKSTSEVLVAQLHGDMKQQEQLQQLTLEMK